MMKTRLAIAALVTVELACAPFPAEAKTHTHFGHHISTVTQSMYPTSALNPPSLSYPTSALNQR